MAKMDELQLLALLNGKEEEAAGYVHGHLAGEREKAMREYFREPYGNEEEGWSTIVSSDVQDTVEWILPSLLKIFTATDEAVSFEPSKEEDVQGAQQATDACNYVFYKQNNGFMTLYTAFKDALMVKNCAVMWRKEDQEVPRTEMLKGVTIDQLALIQQDKEAEIVQASDPYQLPGPDGMPVEVVDVRLKTVEKKTIVKIEAFPPEDLLIDRNWTSPLLQDCPYVGRLMRVSLSDLREMGYDVDAEDLNTGDATVESSADSAYRANRTGQGDFTDIEPDDESQVEGWLRIEFVLVDYDGDGIAERRCIYRLKERILKNEDVTHVPIATTSPIINTHRWDGQSVAEIVSDLQQLKTEIQRQMLNSLYLANNPRTKVLTDHQWAPMANLDDLLDSRPGGILRQRDPMAIQEHVTPWVGGQAFPMLEYVDTMRENRTGVTRYNQGIDANSLNKTASGINQIMSASQQRIELIARIFAETLVKPIFQGVLKLLTDGGMDKLAFRLRNEYVEYDPNEWRDWYDMTVNVGLGTGDKNQQAQHLQMIFQNQMALLPMGLASPQQIYATQSKLTENAGFKNVGDFWIDPQKNQLTPPAHMLQQQMQQMQQQFQQVMQELQATKMDKSIDMFNAETNRLKVMKDAQPQVSMTPEGPQQMNEADRMVLDAQLKAQLKQQEAEAQKEMELFKHQLTVPEVDPVMQGIEALSQQMDMLAQILSAPKEVVRDENGRAVGARIVQ